MRLDTVTFTGADDRTDPADLVRLSRAFPIIEWGVLLTIRSGRPTFPSNAWIEALRQQAATEVHMSGHICSAWAKQVSEGRWPTILHLDGFSRVQLNIARYLREVVSPEALASCLPPVSEYILQVGESREPGLALASRLQALGLRVSALFDASGGRGISPQEWPSVQGALRFGFAGGLGPANLRDELQRMETTVGNRAIWIDIQSGVRSDDLFDLAKVRTCLEACEPYV